MSTSKPWILSNFDPTFNKTITLKKPNFMRTTFVLVASLIISATALSAQDCQAYFPFVEGASWTIVDYNKKGKEQGTTSYTLTSLADQGSEIVAEYDMTMSFGKEEIESSFTASCSEGEFKVSMSELYSSMVAQSMAGMEMDISSDDFTIPFDAQVGDRLSDVSMQLSSSSGPMTMKTTVEHTDRKVEAFEEITTAAGTFDCIKISYSSRAKVMVANVSTQSVDWYAKGVGIVRSESYKNGKLQGYRELKAFSK